MQRYRMDSGGFFVEHTDKQWLVKLRANDYRFRNARIRDIVQLNPSEVEVGRIYSPKTT